MTETEEPVLVISVGGGVNVMTFLCAFPQFVCLPGVRQTLHKKSFRFPVSNTQATFAAPKSKTTRSDHFHVVVLKTHIRLVCNQKQTAVYSALPNF